MVNEEFTVVERCGVLRLVFNAVGKTVLVVSIGIAVSGFMKAGLAGGLLAYLWAVVLSALMFCPYILLVAMPMIFWLKDAPHPAVFSLTAMVTLPLIAGLLHLPFGMFSPLFGLLFPVFYGAGLAFAMRQKTPGATTAHAG